MMAKMGRPKVDNPADKRVTVRFKDEEYDLLLEYAENHKMTIAQVIRLAVERQILTEQK
jgi:hypothetical protein